MNKEEVELIYDYLHENYEYRDGELITKNQRGPVKKGHPVGYYSVENNRYFRAVVHFSIKGQEYDLNLNKVIYIYHHKKCPKYVINIDGNPTNHRIENLKYSDRDSFQYKNIPKRNNKLNVKGVCLESGKYKASFCFNKKNITLGYYSSIEEANEKYIFAYSLLNNFNGSVDEFKYLLKQNGFGRKLKNLPGVETYNSKFRSRIREGGKYINLGIFHTQEEAHAAYLKAKEQYKNEMVLN